MSGVVGRRVAALLGVSLSVLVACDAPTLPLNEAINPADTELPYDFRLTIPATQNRESRTATFHWPLGSRVAVLLVDEAPEDGRPSLQAALAAGIERWNRAAVFGEFTLVETTDPGRADAVVRWTDAEELYSTPASCGGPVTGGATTRGCLTSDGDSLRAWPRIDGGPSRMLLRVFVSREPNMTAERLEILVSHELGHVVGILAHSNRPEDLLWPGPTSPELSDRDGLTLRSLYQTESDLPVSRTSPGT